MARSTANTTRLSDSPEIYRNGEQYKPDMKTRQLKENIVYESKGYYYQTDELGRIKKAQGKLLLEKGVRNRGDQLKAGGDDRLPGDHGGHLIANRYAGSGEIDNLLAMAAIVNNSKYKKIENRWGEALQEGKEVEITIDVVYDGASKRPKEFNINYSIDKKKEKLKISNGD